MNMHAEKTPQNVNSTVAKTAIKKNNLKPASQFVDNRPETSAQMKLQKRTDTSPRITAQCKKVENLFGTAQQTKGGNQKKQAELPVVQAKIKNPLEKVIYDDPGITSILEQVTAYNKIGGHRFTFPLKERKAAITQIGVIERLIYSWFGNQRSADLDTKQVNTAMKTLMNRVLTERKSLVALSLGNQDEQPPIADFDELPRQIREEITMIWNHLLAGKGILIEGAKEFKIKVLTDFSRLLETQMGRTLAGGIIQSDKGLIITQTTMDKGKYAARPKDSEKEGLKQTEDHEQFVPVDVRGMDEETRLQFLQHVRGENPQSPGMSVTSEQGVKHFSFGEGTGSSLPVPIDSKDAMADSSSRMADRSGNEVIAPTFINLGHELGHVLRSAQGISAGGEGGRALLEHGFDNKKASRTEEFFNIGGVENRLRKESGMTERHGHGNLYSHWAVQGMTSVQDMMDQIGKELQTVGAESTEGIRLTGLLKRLDPLIEHFQLLMNGKGNITELMNALTKIKAEYYFG